MKYDTIIWDIDGTLLNTKEGLISSYRYAIESLKLEAKTDEEISNFIGPVPQSVFKNIFGLDDIQAQKGADIFRERYKNHDLLKAYLYDGILEVLEYFKSLSVKQAVATNKRHDYALDICKHFKIDTYCNPILGSDNKSSRTKAELILEIIKKNNSKNSIMIGDTTGDKNAALEARIDFLGVNFGFGFKNQNTYANSARDIIKILNC